MAEVEVNWKHCNLKKNFFVLICKQVPKLIQSFFRLVHCRLFLKPFKSWRMNICSKMADLSPISISSSDDEDEDIVLVSFRTRKSISSLTLTHFFFFKNVVDVWSNQNSPCIKINPSVYFFVK